MFVKGMTEKEMMDMVREMGWEILEQYEYEAYDDTMAKSFTVYQADHAVAVDVFHGVIDTLEYIPDWAL